MAAAKWRKALPWLRVAAGVAVIAALVRIVGGSAFLAGVRAIDWRSVLAALVITIVTTACSSWRWRLVIRGLGGELRAGRAMGAYYRSQFLDATLPGGVLGDVFRAVRRGVHVGNLGRGLRGVFWERTLGQVVLLVLAAVLLLLLPSPVHRAMPVAVGVVVAAAICTALGIRAALPHLAGRWGRALAAALQELHGLSAGDWVGVAVASVVATAGYIAVFAIAAHAVGISLPGSRLVPLLLLALVASAVPFNVAGFGPREGVAAWAFGAAGVGAAHGVAASTLYGILGLIATAPGALLLLLDWLHPERARSSRGPGA